ncbi:MAG: NUDIX domain-containing protein [Candidatus Neomarinimicrobiota bacterium]
MTDIISTHVDSYAYRWEGGKPLYLLLKRNEEAVYGHLWQGVAGKMQGGETAVETVLRELKEETGLDPNRIFVVDHVSLFYQSYRDRLHVVPVFGVEVESKEVRLSKEHTEFRWLSFDDAFARLSWTQQRESIAVLHDMLLKRDERVKWSEVNLEKYA